MKGSKIQMQNQYKLLDVKNKINDFMNYYEKLTVERDFQKQKIKQSVMLDLLRDKHKNVTPQTTNKQLSRAQKLSKRQDSNSLMSKKNNQLSHIQSDKEFDSKQINVNKKLEQLMNRSRSLPNNQYEINQIQHQYFSKNQNAAAQITFNQKQPGVNQLLFKNSQGIKQSLRDSLPYLKKIQNQFSQGEPEQNQSQVRQQPQCYSALLKTETIKIQQQISQNASKKNNFQNQGIQSGYSSRDPENIENYNYGNSENEEQGGFFLTGDNNEEQPKDEGKNIAYDIVMDKSQSVDNLEQLKKKKIMQLQMKRQQRLSQNKKTDSSKNKYANYGRKSYQKPTVSQFSEDENQKIKQNNSKVSQKPVPHQIQSAHQLRQTVPSLPPKKIDDKIMTNKFRGSHIIDTDRQEKRSVSPNLNTPKTGYSNKNNKIVNRATVFAQSPHRDKSITKYSQQPKIEPKQRNNAFTRQSNKKMMIGALNSAILPGQINRKQREKLVNVIQSDPNQFFIFLFKEYSRKSIKGIYVFDPVHDKAKKIYGDKAPQQLFSDQVRVFYRFDSGSKQFKKLDGCKSFSLAVYAIDLT